MTLTDHSESESGKLRISVERWRIDGVNSPSFIESRVMIVSCTDVQWSLYNTPCSRKVAFIPQSTSGINPGTVALLDGGSGLRIGSCILFKNDDSQGLMYTPAGSKCSGKTASGDGVEERTDESPSKSKSPKEPVIEIAEDATTLKEYCEEIAHCANLLVICRRRIPKSEPAETQPHRNRDRRSRSPRRSYSDSSGYDSDEIDIERNSEDDEVDDEAPAFSDTSSLGPRSSSDSLKSELDDSETLDGKLDHKSTSSCSETNGFDVGSSSAESCDGSDSTSSLGKAEGNDSDDTDSSSLLSVPSSESSYNEVHEHQLVGEDGLDSRVGYEYPVEITGQPMAKAKVCDQCQEAHLETWYHCPVCYDSDYDLCHQCVKDGAWCLDKNHQLYEEVSREGVVSIISWSAFLPGQELLIFDTNSTMEKPIFTRSVAESATLHRSAPASHPLLQLVVWPIRAENLLFVDANNLNTSQKRCFSEQSFKATTSKGTISTLHHFNYT